MEYIGKAEMEFGKQGFLKYENEDIIVYYVPYAQQDIHHKDITFVKNTGRIILYEGTNFGPDAFKMDEKLIYPIYLQSKEIEETYGRELQGETEEVQRTL